MIAATPRADPRRLVALADALLLLSGTLRSAVATRAAASPEEAAEVARLAALEGDVARAFAEAVAPAAGADAAAAGTERTRLFDGAAACPPNETAWIRRDKGHVLADIAGFYRAFGFRIASGAAEKGDHVAAELQFVAVLLVYLARAIERGEIEREAITRDALASFVDDHPGAWIGAFCERLAVSASGGVLRAAAAAVPAVLATAVRQAGIEPRPAATIPSPDDAPGTPYECDGCLADRPPEDGRQGGDAAAAGRAP